MDNRIPAGEDEAAYQDAEVDEDVEEAVGVHTDSDSGSEDTAAAVEVVAEVVVEQVVAAEAVVVTAVVVASPEPERQTDTLQAGHSTRMGHHLRSW